MTYMHVHETLHVQVGGIAYMDSAKRFFICSLIPPLITGSIPQSPYIYSSQEKQEVASGGFLPSDPLRQRSTVYIVLSTPSGRCLYLSTEMPPSVFNSTHFY